MKPKINILYVTWGLFIGGAELVVANLCRNINRDLFDISVCYLKLNGPIGRELACRGVDVFSLPKSRYLDIKYLSFLKIASLIKKRRINIIHSHDTPSLVGSSLCRLIRKEVKIVHTFHFGNYPYLEGNNLILERCSWRIPDRLIAVGNVQKKAIQETLGIPDNRIMTVWNGIEKPEEAHINEMLRKYSEKGKIIIGSLSTLTEQKGLTYLLDVAYVLKKRNSDFIFIIVGGGPLFSDLKKKCKSLGLQDIVIFLGWVENAASRVLPVFDIFVQPSIWEAMSMVLLEAMAVGKPIVTTNVGENKYIIDNGVNGFIVEPRDVSMMALVIEKLISDPNLRSALGTAAKKKYEHRCTALNMTTKYEQIYLDVLKE